MHVILDLSLFRSQKGGTEPGRRSVQHCTVQYLAQVRITYQISHFIYSEGMYWIYHTGTHFLLILLDTAL